MLARRVVASVVVRNGWVVQSVGFSRYLPVGRLSVVVEYLDRWGVDEIVIADISATREDQGPDLALLASALEFSLVPVTVVGGVRSLGDAEAILSLGAEKVGLNQSALRTPELLTEIVYRFGSQAVLASVDYVESEEGIQVWDYIAGESFDAPLPDLTLQLQDRGAGELLLRNASRDGLGSGFDVETAGRVSSALHIPVVCAGGAGCPDHFLQVFSGSDVSGAAAGNFFHFSEHSVAKVKAFLRDHVRIRDAALFGYSSAQVARDGSLNRLSDDALYDLLFERVEEPEI